MAWIDDRIWCHPKFAGVSKPSVSAWMFALCYSNGFGLFGHLTADQLQLIHVSAKERDELIARSLWHDAGGGAITIHDWAEHNGERDDKRAAARDRKRRERDRKRDAQRDRGVTERDNSRDSERAESVTSRARGPAPDDRVKDEGQNPRAVTAPRPQRAPTREPQPDSIELHPLVAELAPELEPIP